MRTRLIRQRGGPLYFGSGDSTVSLVPEVGIREWRIGGASGPVFQTRTPPAVFVIDDGGVRRLELGGRRNAVLAVLIGALTVGLLGWRVRAALRSHGGDGA